jgi:hypothetical protein
MAVLVLAPLVHSGQFNGKQEKDRAIRAFQPALPPQRSSEQPLGARRVLDATEGLEQAFGKVDDGCLR